MEYSLANDPITLQDIWSRHHEAKGYKNFIYDGIVNATLWAASKKKVCFFLKEAYLKNDSIVADNNLCNWLNTNDVWRMWWVVSDWIYAIEHTTASSIPRFSTENLDIVEKANHRVRSSAIINIKKSDGAPSSTHDDLLLFAHEDQHFIKKQLLSIDPKIIVCGNTRFYFETIFGYDNFEKRSAEYNGYTINHDEFCEKGYYWAGETLIIDFCHPANYFMRKGKYYALCALYQQACIEKEGAKK